MIQNVLLTEEVWNRGIKIDPYAMLVYKSVAFIVERDGDALYEFDKHGGVKFITKIEDGMEKCEFKLSGMIRNKNNILLFPNYGRSLVIYNILERSMVYKEINEEILADYFGRTAFIESKVYKEKCFIIRTFCDYIFYFDIQKLEINYININANKENYKNFEVMVLGDCVCKKELLFIPLFKTNKLLVLNMEKCDWIIKEIKSEIEIVTLCANDDKLYAVNIDGTEICEIDWETWDFTIIKLSIPDGFRQEMGDNSITAVYNRSFFYKKYIYLIPFAFSNMIVRLDVMKKKAVCFCKFDLCSIYNYTLWQDELILCTNLGAKRINLITGLNIDLDCFAEGDMIDRHMLSKINTNKIMNEGEIKLKYFVMYLLNNQKENEDERCDEKKKQKNIYWNI